MHLTPFAVTRTSRSVLSLERESFLAHWKAAIIIMSRVDKKRWEEKEHVTSNPPVVRAEYVRSTKKWTSAY